MIKPVIILLLSLLLLLGIIRVSLAGRPLQTDVITYLLWSTKSEKPVSEPPSFVHARHSTAVEDLARVSQSGKK